MEKVNLNKSTLEQEPAAKISLIRVTPVLTGEQLMAMTKGTDVVVLITFATGTTSERLNPTIKQIVDSGTPVLLVSDNRGDTHGILKETYETQEKAREAGAIALQKVNVNNRDEILKAINEEFALGKRGAELSNAIYQRFAYGESEERPRAEWER